MKFLFTVLFVFLFTGLRATNYYVSAIGDDGNRGLSAATAFRTPSRVNQIIRNLKPGDSVLFRRGDRFYGSLTINASGSAQAPIVIGAYGSGPAPVINGLKPLTLWTVSRPGVYEAKLPAMPARPKVVLMNNKLQGMGRYPNARTSNGGYLSYETHTGLNSITDRDFKTETDWTGAEIVIRKNRWVIDKAKILKQERNTFTYQSPTGQEPSDNFGYFIQNDPRTLDQPGEWFYDTTSGKLQIFFGKDQPPEFAVQVAVEQSLINCHGQQYLVIENLAFEGANGKTIDISDNANYLTIRGCRISFSGEFAINGNFLHHFTLEKCEIANSLNSAVYIAPFTSAVRIVDNTIKNTGLIAGLGANDNQALEGIVVHGQVPMLRNLVQGNRIDSTGYIPITFLGDSITVQQNYITNFCLVTDDGGGIYTAGNYDSRGRRLINNIVLDGKGSNGGTNQSDDVAAHGIYMDDRSANVEVRGNTIARCSEHGIFLHNASTINITENTIYNCKGSQIGMNEDSQFPIRMNTVANNILFSGKETQFITDMRSIKDDLTQFGLFDHNYIYHPNDAKPVARMYSPSAKNDLGFAPYQRAYSQNTRSKKIGIVPAANVSFIFNPGARELPLTLKGSYKDVRGKVYPGKIILAPFSSAILLKI